MNFFSHNGIITPEKESDFIFNNRGLLYGDGFFESMLLRKGSIQYIDDHFERINKAIHLLKLDFILDKPLLIKEINQLYERIGINGDARVRLTFFRTAEGNYTPAENSTARMIHIKSLPSEKYILNEKGWNIGIYKEQSKSKSSLSNIKSLNSLVSVLAGITAKENKLDDILLVNDSGNISEAHTSNVFIVKDDMLITPPLTDGCVDGVMRKQIIQIASQAGITCIEKSISEGDVKSADELFITNVINGIRWVERFGNIRYIKKVSTTLYENLISGKKKE